MESPKGTEQLLPGLEEPDTPTGAVELAARRTLAALDSEQLLKDRDALLCQALVTLAHQYDRAASSSRAKDYAIANLHAQLLATIAELPVPVTEGGDPDDPWKQLENELAKQGEAKVRDAT